MGNATAKGLRVMVLKHGYSSDSPGKLEKGLSITSEGSVLARCLQVTLRPDLETMASGQCFSSFNVHMSHLEILLKCRLQVSSSEGAAASVCTSDKFLEMPVFPVCTLSSKTSEYSANPKCMRWRTAYSWDPRPSSVAGMCLIQF